MSDATPHRTYYEEIGFSANPFEGNTAEREPEIDEYAVRPPYLDPVEEASKNGGSYTLSGSRGSGKSATRITVQKNIWKLPDPHPLPLTLSNFSLFRGKWGSQVLLDLYAKQVFFLTIEACLIYSAANGEQIEDRLKKLSSPDKKFFDWSLRNYYLNRDAGSRLASAQECCDAFSVSLGRRSKMWAEKKWDALTGSLVQLTAGIAKYFEIDLGETSVYKDALSGPKNEDMPDPAYVLKKSVEFSRLMGFSGILVQVDKVDETDWTTNDAEAAASLVWPLYSNVQLHEIDGFSWSFFLWDRVRSLLTKENDMPVRWDKLPHDSIKWDQRHLVRLVERRLEHFSNQKVKHLLDLFDAAPEEEDYIYAQFLTISGFSPRTLITVLNSVITNHIQSNEGRAIRLTMRSLESGLDNYCSRSILDDYSAATIGQLKRVKTTTFINRDVAKAFTISSPGALQKIEKWINIGLVRRTGQRFAGERTKPVDEFAVSEPRARRIIERNLDLREAA
ncbi:MAG: hypothetical protein WAW12_10830 [Pseudomonas sp.]